MSHLARRAAALAFTFALAFSAVGSTPTVAAADISVGAAELEMVRLINAERAKHGLLAVRVDSRLMSIARARSTDMATKHYFDHGQPDGRSVFDLINAAGIRWYAAGEIIAWNSGYSTLADSAAAARDGWLNSPGHRSVMLSTGYNYVGIGLAIDASNGKRLWTGVFMKGPDRTGGWVSFKPVPDLDLKRGTYKAIRVYWSGGDVRLVVLTAGLRSYQIQVRTDGGAWKWWSYGTSATYRDIRIWGGHNYDLRVRACDRAGNCGSWRTQHIDS